MREFRADGIGFAAFAVVVAVGVAHPVMAHGVRPPDPKRLGHPAPGASAASGPRRSVAIRGPRERSIAAATAGERQSLPPQSHERLPGPQLARAASPNRRKTTKPGQYLMDRTAEIALARSAAPDSISGDATILVLGPHGCEVAVHGTNGFVCFVGRAWLAAFDWDEFWNPRVRAADCLNPQAAHFIVPIIELRARMIMAGRSRAEILAALRAAYRKKQLPRLESGAMDYMMAKSSWLTDEGAHNMPHLMFYTRVKDGKDWGSGAAGAPVLSSPYWFVSPQDRARMKGLPPVLVFFVAVPDSSDGTSASRR